MTVATALIMVAAGALCSVQSTPQPPAVVELFTSQGCSSCPPADQWLGTLGARYGERVIALSLHVGYWDYIGWKDPFARREFTERQRRLTAANGGSTVYTPGVFVQGRELRNWSRTSTMDAAVRAAQQPSKARLELSLQAVAPTAVTVRAHGEAAAGSQLWLALVQDAASTAVKAGENRGEMLRNHHVVRDWHGPLVVGDVVQPLALPAGETATTGWSVVALIDQPSGSTVQAVRLPLAQCTAGPAR